MTSIEERLNMTPEPWKPQKGDQLIGTITDLSNRTSDYGEYPIVTISNNDGNWDFHAFHTVAREEIKRRRPDIGDQIGISYQGKPDGKDYEVYRIVIERSTSTSTPLPATADEPF